MASKSSGDALGMVLSGACALHCAVVGLAAAAPGALSGLIAGNSLFSEHPLLEGGLFLGAVAVAVPTLVSGARRHQSLVPLAIASVGVLFVGMARALHLVGVEAVMVGASVPAEIPLSVGGGALLIAAHGLNWRRCSALVASGAAHGCKVCPAE